ncbi:xanthine phosphoribosyltransferase [Ruminococcus bromii]|uniref:Xanthine phosphoribosyltransferase n=1 Tax=Ruminococcus bromii TaxID=40518 RepID=A0A2N0UHZ2_9FIRM|nr:xanthine phosphoribosyltransferase [Ruminococcus bromii]PKD26604.1 Xanthine phosphoribosyltransferase [Ruminococcus bromii]
MKLLEDKILKDGHIGEENVLKVDSFLNHQIDVSFVCELGKEFYRLFKDENITKILTIEASGIGIACLTAQYFNVPVVFAKKTKTINIYSDTYNATVHSYTHKRDYDIVVSKDFLNKDDNVLIIDDFLAKGSALTALLMLIEKAGAKTAGAGIVIEKAYQGGGNLVRDMGIRVESLAKIKSISKKDGIVFCKQ